MEKVFLYFAGFYKINALLLKAVRSLPVKIDKGFPDFLARRKAVWKTDHPLL